MKKIAPKYSMIGEPTSFYIYRDIGRMFGSGVNAATEWIKGNSDLYYKIKQKKVDIKSIWQKFKKGDMIDENN